MGFVGDFPRALAHGALPPTAPLVAPLPSTKVILPDYISAFLLG